MNLIGIPDWLGTAIIAALFAVLGFLGRNLLESIEKRRTKKSDSIRQLEKLKYLIDESQNIFDNQNYLVRRLNLSLRAQYSDKAISGLGYDETFYRMYEKMNSEQRELFDLIRGITMNSMRRVNEDLRKWIEDNSSRELLSKSSKYLKIFDEQLVLLRQHLNTWLDKYNSIFKASERRSLVYLSDEKEHGEKFPPELNEVVDMVLADLEGRQIPKKKTQLSKRSTLEIDIDSLRYFIGTLQLFNAQLESNWTQLNTKWQSSSETWRDITDKEIQWEEARQLMNQYLELMNKYSAYLKMIEQRAQEYFES